MRKIIFLIISALFLTPVFACTIFVLTDANTALFFNNEDYTNSNTKMWFIPAGADHYGCVYVGYDDGSAQGGLNTEGLAFDWYAGEPAAYLPAEHLIPINDNSSERMLEQCATVDQAIAFYKTYAEPGFAKASIIIADKSGASVIIGARNGKLYFERSATAHVLGGAGKAIFESMYNDKTPVNLAGGSEILKQCVAKGRGGTLYSNSYNLKTGDIHVYDFSGGNKHITLNLYEELEKGAHYYELPRLQSGDIEAVAPLSLNMKRLILFEFETLADNETGISAMITDFFTDAAKGTLKERYLSASLWRQLSQDLEGLQKEMARMGPLKSVNLIQEDTLQTHAQYACVLIFQKVRMLAQFRIDEQGKIADIKTLSSFAHPEFFLSANEKAESKPNMFNTNLRYLLIGLAAAVLAILVYIMVKRRAAR